MYPIRLYLRSLPNRILILASLILNLASFGVLLWQIPHDQQIFLHFNILYGVDYAGEWWRVFYVPMTGLAVFLFTLIVGWFAYQKDHFMSYLLHAVSTLCQVFLLVAAILLLMLNV